MSTNVFHKLGSKATENKNEGSNEPMFSTQPHPAKINNPAELGNPAPSTGMGLNNNEKMAPFHARDPHVPTDPDVTGEIRKTRN
ncbi:hypothetical protein GYMLUDRAFT_263161 [Collybiopsis luxurians FD-317 M1]|uniref:Uncharacterized protein n=1 Tax=Collybiopsis luxurians FD-317 M1 TaxID=944289 RepID=A0A0D0CGU1_9AGAR|nr:hypothetical protein GYMLUDRAFT_263161 [Collybiopsis luxurians FD-317 M1]